VVCIKSKVFIISLTLALLITTISIMFTNGAIATENRLGLEFVGEPSYELINRVTKGGKTVGWTYRIQVDIKNNGDQKSQETTTNLTDEEGFELKNITTFQPGETKTINFLWSTTYGYDQTINVNYFPTEVDTNWNPYNSGKTSFKLIIDKEGGIPAAGTPGFEFILLIVVLSAIIFYFKRQK